MYLFKHIYSYAREDSVRVEPEEGYFDGSRKA